MITDKKPLSTQSIKSKLKKVLSVCSLMKKQLVCIKKDLQKYQITYSSLSKSKSSLKSSIFNSKQFSNDNKQNCSSLINTDFHHQEELLYPQVSKWLLPQSKLKQEILSMVKELKDLQEKQQIIIQNRSKTDCNQYPINGIKDCQSIFQDNGSMISQQQSISLNPQMVDILCENKHVYYYGTVNIFGKPHGYGRFVPCKEMSSLYPEIKSYHGGFKNGMFHGLGTLTQKSGVRYVGQFLKNQKKGHGSLYEEAGKMKMGYWDEDKLIKIL